MLTVTLNNPNYAPGTKLAVRGLGVFENGTPKEITPEQETAYLSLTGNPVSSLKGVFNVGGSAAPPPSVDLAPPPVVPLEEEGAPETANEESEV